MAPDSDKGFSLATLLARVASICQHEVVWLMKVLPGLYIIFWILRAVVRIYLHPLSRFPGPKLAAASAEWWEWYWNFHQQGELLFEIERLHIRHGMEQSLMPNVIETHDTD